MCSIVPFRAAVGTTVFLLGTVVHLVAMACPYWFHLTYKDMTSHEGLWEVCLCNKTSGIVQCHPIPTSYPVWFHGVQTLECLGAMCELVTMVMAACYLYRRLSYINWFCQLFSFFAGLLVASGAIIYTQRKNYSEWNIALSSYTASPISSNITDYKTELSWAYGLVVGSSGLDCLAAVFFVWESCARSVPITSSGYERLP